MKTIPAMFQNSVKHYGDNPMMFEHDGQHYQPITYHQMNLLVNEFANGLLSLGTKKGDRIILLSEGRNDWVMSELAVVFTGAINVPVSVKVDEPGDLIFRINHSDASIIIVSGRHAPKILALGDKIPGVKNIILLDNTEDSDSRILFRDQVIDSGKEFAQAHPNLLGERIQSIIPQDIANICYTSGTTADPKGIMLSHLNYITNIDQAGELFEIPPYFTSVLILPWDHSFAHTAGIYALMKNGASMASVRAGKSPLDTLKNIPLNIRENRPYFLLSVPALAKNFKKNIEKGVEMKGSFLKRLFDHGIALSTTLYGDGYTTPQVKNKLWKKIQYSLINRVIYKKVRENFGGRLRFFVGGGALLDTDLQHFFYALKIPMFQGYGLTEAAPIISSNTPTKHKLGSSGYIVKNLELKICDGDGHPLPQGETGEIVIKGDNVMAGYWKNEYATAEALRNGWLFTGDMGYLDADGFLYVKGRYKSLLISNDGEKYSPEGIEEAIIEKCSLIDQVMLINNQHPYTGMLVVPNKSACRAIITETGKQEKDSIIHILQKISEEVNMFKEDGIYEDWFPQRWLPSAFAVLDEEFNEQNQLINSTMKIVRGKICDHFANRIDELFLPENKSPDNDKNIQALSTFLAR